MIVGIDLGTTHSLIGIYEGNAPRLFPNAVGDVLTPSVVSVGDDGGILVGQGARDRLITHPGASVAAFKRWMGTSRNTRLGKREFRPEELSALVRTTQKEAEAKGTLGNGHYDDTDSMFEDVFADLPWHLAEQQAAARAETRRGK